jgi:hypothetical protein
MFFSRCSMYSLAVLLASRGAQGKERWRELLLNAFQASSHEDASVSQFCEELRNLSVEEQRSLGFPENASDLELYEYLMREGAALLLLLEK